MTDTDTLVANQSKTTPIISPFWILHFQKSKIKHEVDQNAAFM